MSVGLRFATRLVLGGCLLAIVILTIWLFAPDLGSQIDSHPAFYPAAFIAMGMLMLSLAVVLWLESTYFKKSWFLSAAEQAELEVLETRSHLRRFISKLPDPLEWLWMPLWGSGIGQEMCATWTTAGMRWKPSRYPSLLLVLAAVAYLVGVRVAGQLLGAALAGAAVWGLSSIVKARGDRRYREVDEQLPNAVDAIAAGIASGQSFQLALHATADEQHGALGPVLKVVSTRLKLGIPVEEALLQLFLFYAFPS